MRGYPTAWARLGGCDGNGFIANGIAKGNSEMPRGDADKVHKYAGQLVRDARSNGEKEIVIRVGDIRDALGLNYSDAAIDICQVLETQRFQRENGVLFDSKSGPKQGVGTDYMFRIL